MDNVPAPAPGPCWSSPCCHPDKSCSGWASRARGAGWGRAQPCQSCRTRRNLAPQKCRAQDLACGQLWGGTRQWHRALGEPWINKQQQSPAEHQPRGKTSPTPGQNVPNSGAVEQLGASALSPNQTPPELAVTQQQHCMETTDKTIDKTTEKL